MNHFSWRILYKRLYGMTLARTTVGINKVEDDGGWMPKSGFADALRRAFPTTVSSYSEFCSWIRRQTWCDRSSVTFD